MKRREEGTISVMIVGFFVVIGLLAVVVINASAAFLQRQELNNVADGAALAAADGLRLESVYREGVDEKAPIDLNRARQLVGSYLSSTASGIRAWSVTIDGQTVHVHVHVHVDRVIELPLVPPGWFSSTRVTADAAAILRVES